MYRFLLDDDDNLLIHSDDEKMALINAETKTNSEMEMSLEEAKKEVILQFTKQVNGLCSRVRGGKKNNCPDKTHYRCSKLSKRHGFSIDVKNTAQ